MLPDEVPDTFYGTAWSADASALFYVTVDEAWRPNRVWRHMIGTAATEDVLVYEENDERFWVGRRADPLRAVRADRRATARSPARSG